MSTVGYIVNMPKLKERENYDDESFTVKKILVVEGIDMDEISSMKPKKEKQKRS